MQITYSAPHIADIAGIINHDLQLLQTGIDSLLMTCLYTLTSANTDDYADANTLYVAIKSLETIERNLQDALNILAKLCKCNDMFISSTKSKVMLITTHQKS